MVLHLERRNSINGQVMLKLEWHLTVNTVLHRHNYRTDMTLHAFIFVDSMTLTFVDLCNNCY